MKKIFTLLAAAALTVSSYAQDMGLYQYAADDYMVKGLSYMFYYSIANYDTVDYPADSSIVAGVTVDGNLANYTSYSFTSDFPASYSYSGLSLSVPSSYTDTMTTTNDSVTVCLVLAASNDPNVLNDVVCTNVAWNDNPTIDLGGFDLEAYSNDTLIPSQLANGATPSVDSVVATIKNYGDAFPFGSTVSYEVTLGTTTTGAFSGTVFAFNFLTDSVSTRTVTNTTYLSNLVFPGTGTVDMCVTTSQANDADASNDSYCNTYEYATGVESLVGADNALKAYFSNEVLNLNVVSSEAGNARVAIVNVAGQEVEAHNVNLLGNESVENFQVQTTDLASGIYFVKVNDEVVKVFK